MMPSLIQNDKSRLSIRLGLSIILLGMLVFMLGADPDLFGLDRSPVVGYVQIGVFLGGLGIICVGGYTCLNGLWGGDPKTIAADIGLRLVATGYMIAVISGLADILGFGSHTTLFLAYFGPWQSRGVVLGEAVIIIGFLLLIPYHRRKSDG